jgi:N-acetylglutamate synthase-like GNAT family acetyltransferase
MDIPADRGATARPLLVRRADPAAIRHVATLLRDAGGDAGLDAGQVAELLRHGGVFVLSDVTLPPSAPPVAAAAFRLDAGARTAELAGIGVPPPLRRRGWGYRLLTGTLTVLRAEGFERVLACVRPGTAGASLLTAAGFTEEAASGTGEEEGTVRDSRVRSVLLL